MKKTLKTIYNFLFHKKICCHKWLLHHAETTGNIIEVDYLMCEKCSKSQSGDFFICEDCKDSIIQEDLGDSK